MRKTKVIEWRIYMYTMQCQMRNVSRGGEIEEKGADNRRGALAYLLALLAARASLAGRTGWSRWADVALVALRSCAYHRTSTIVSIYLFLLSDFTLFIPPSLSFFLLYITFSPYSNYTCAFCVQSTLYITTFWKLSRRVFEFQHFLHSKNKIRGRNQRVNW